MGLKDELFSFRGVVVCLIHLVFAVGVCGFVGLGAWIWTGTNPIREHVKYQDQKEAIEYLIDTNPGYTVKLIPEGGKGR